MYTPGVLLATFAPSILTPSILTSAVSFTGLLNVNSTALPTTRAPNNSGAFESENVFSVSRYFSTGFKSAPNTPVVECTAYLSELANALPATNLNVTLLPSFERTPFYQLRLQNQQMLNFHHFV